MDMFDFRQRNYMTPGGGNFGSNFGNTGSFGIQRQPTPFQGMEIQGPLGNDDPSGGGYAPSWNTLPEPESYDPMGVQARMKLQQAKRARQPGLAPEDFVSQPTEQRPFTGMQVAGPLGSTPGEPNYEAPESPNMPEQQEQTPKEFDIFEAMYNAPTPALEAYKRHIMSMPKQEDYRAGKMDRFIAGLTGAAEGLTKGGGAGYTAARGIVDSKYNAALQNYANQGQGLGTLAELESNDMKSKMNYAKTMMEQRRADTKEAREGRKADADINLTKAQEEKMRADLALVGKELETSSADGMLYVVDKGKQTRTPVGKFKLTAEEEAKIARETHKINAGVDVGADVSRARQISPITEQREKNILGFRVPLEAQTNLDLFNAKAPITLANAMRQREHAANNPIKTGGFNSIQPSQTKIAFDYGSSRAALERPEFYDFLDDSPSQRARHARNKPELYDEFKALAQKYNNEAVAAAKKEDVGGTSTRTVTPAPEPAVLPVRQSPITAPSAPNDPLRAQAVEMLKVNKPEAANDEKAIADVIEILRSQQAK